MVGNVVAHKGGVKCRTKVKTGCGTCRIRRVKCDEVKPSCNRCVSTGRTCDGYQSTFRVLTNQPVRNKYAGGIKSDVSAKPNQIHSKDPTPLDIDLLNRYFSVKTMFGVTLGCHEEAKQVLQASLTDPHIRHAIQSLRAFRENFESLQDSPAAVTQTSPGYHEGIEQYSLALRGLASKLSSLGSNGVKSALLCCQLFISIEQLRRNYVIMAQHIVQGLKIMQEYHARPSLHAAKKLLPANHIGLPLVDVFILKLFLAPCKFAEPPTTLEGSETASPTCTISPGQSPAESRDLRMLAPNMRTELRRIATSTIEYLNKVAQVDSVEMAHGLLPEKAALLESARSWLMDLELVQMETISSRLEPIQIMFLRFFHSILSIIILGALDSSADLHVRSQPEYDRLLDVAERLSERLKDFKMNSRIGTDQGERLQAR